MIKNMRHAIFVITDKEKAMEFYVHILELTLTQIGLLNNKFIEDLLNEKNKCSDVMICGVPPQSLHRTCWSSWESRSLPQLSH